MNYKRNNGSTTSIVLAGPEGWRTVVGRVVSDNPALDVVAGVECNPRDVSVHSISSADVILMAVDAQRPNDAIEFSLQIQAKDPGTSIALVLPEMGEASLRKFHKYGGSWSMISAAACIDPVRIGAVIASAGRGIAWVDPIITRLLKTFEFEPEELDIDIEASAIDDFVRGISEPEEPDRAIEINATDDPDKDADRSDELENEPADSSVDEPALDASDLAESEGAIKNNEIDEAEQDINRPGELESETAVGAINEPMSETDRLDGLDIDELTLSLNHPSSRSNPESPVGKILVVDDNDGIRLALTLLLEDAGHEVTKGHDGSEAVQLAQITLPDLILLDVMMPVMDGFEALKNLKALPATRHIPVIMVTAKGGTDDLDRARNLGALDYISKPWLEGEVEASVAWALSRVTAAI